MIICEHKSEDFLNHKIGELYILATPNFEYVKIGSSLKTSSRIKSIQTGCPFKLEVVKILRTPLYENIESCLHHMYGEFNTIGEWFKFPDMNISELIELIDNTASHISDIANNDEAVRLALIKAV